MLFLKGVSLSMGDREGTWSVATGSTFRYEGLGDIIIPIITVIAICVNTLLGHVEERKHEIAVYTSVGLAPNHVGMLFIMEALSLAVLSCVAGYILAQVGAGFFGKTALFAGLQFNYSSLSSVTSMVLIFTVVFIASLYPARLATHIAMPDVEKSWHLPPPHEGSISVDLPFLFPHRDQSAIIRYLGELIVHHREVSSEVFIADEIHWNWADVSERDGPSHRTPVPQCALFQATIWLAPFDFGMKQRVHLFCCPASLESTSPQPHRTTEVLEREYVQIHLHMICLAGELEMWHRANRQFVKILRKRVLQWHTLSDREKDRYRV